MTYPQTFLDALSNIAQEIENGLSIQAKVIADRQQWQERLTKIETKSERRKHGCN